MAEPTFNAIAERERALLAPYAMHSADSAGRRYAEPPHPYRGPYQRDRDRILHSAAFRRLSQKTQVFTGEMGDYHRTRLTHTLEVASIARTIARALRLNEDLVEALAMAHDLGHPPFGHSGEEVLNDCLQDHGGFNHNAQALRICEVLESRYPDFPGLNLSQEVLEGQRHRAEKEPAAESTARGADDRLPTSRPLPPAPRSPLLEVQAVEAADSIAYDAHDADDSLEIGLLELGQLLEVPLWREARQRVYRRFSNLDNRQLRRAIVHEVIDWQVSDVLDVAQRRLAALNIESIDSVRRVEVIVRPSVELAERKFGLESFLFDTVYRHPKVLLERRPAQQALRETFELLVNDPGQLPPKFQGLADRDGVPRGVADYLAGMTDRFALDEHARLEARFRHCEPNAG
ncbi:MAG: deoxyguanosinetriphosphate triphosphohydrolase [Pirellulales bacterium]